MTTTLVLTAVVALSGLAISLAALALCHACRRRIGSGRAETARRLHALTARVAALEARCVEASPAPPAPTPAPAARRVDRPEPSAVVGPTLIAVPNLAATSADAPVPSELGRRFATVWAMADSGATADKIAVATGQPVGRIELILGLRRQLSSATGGPRLP